ncbi:MAG: leucine-rich repeat domain-containing protein [Microcoleus sp.]
MTLIVAQKYINLPRSIALTCCVLLALSGNGLSAKAAEVRSGNKTFAEWCREKDSLSPEAKHTVEVLLKEAETTECDAANQKLSSLTALFLWGNQISDIKPLESLNNLITLHISNNQISDIKPLASLPNLITLSVGNNQISDIKPLASLTKLTWLDLNNNKISDIKPLLSLTKLAAINLENNQINDIKPLQSLTNLIWLQLSGNPIAPKTCPLKPESICKWKPQFKLRKF